MREREPWTIHADLTQPRLVDVARLILRGRNDALDRFNPGIGDDSWTLGCSAFQFQRHQILTACVAGRFPWLSLVDPSKQFIFKIGGVPMRFYRGAAEEPSARTLQQSYPELSQLSLFPKEAEARDYAHRLAVETDIEGAVTAIKYVALSDEGPEFYWDIPLSGSVAAIRPIGEKPAEGVELPAPVIQLADDDEDQAQKPG